MIHVTENIFNDFSTNFYLEKIKNESFTIKDTIVSFGKKNYYNRYKITDSSENEKIAISYLKKLYLIDYELIGVWVNRVDNNSNNDDSFHYDGCDLTMITYLNQNFNGGEFEYINENNSKSVIIPKKKFINNY